LDALVIGATNKAEKEARYFVWGTVHPERLNFASLSPKAINN